MDELILYSTGCPKCNVLKKKLNNAGIKYKEVNDVNEMEKLGIDSVPMLKVNNKLLSFIEAVNYINETR